MTLAQEFKEETSRLGYTSYANHDEIADKLGATFVHYDIVDEWRWGNVVEYVYKRDDEYVLIQYQEASGDGECDYMPDIAEVVPETKTITVYKKKT